MPHTGELFKKGDLAILFYCSHGAHEEVRIAQVSKVKFGTPRVRLEGRRTFDHSAAADNPEWSASELLLHPDDLPRAKEIYAATVSFGRDRRAAAEFVANARQSLYSCSDREVLSRTMRKLRDETEAWFKATGTAREG